MYDTHPYLVLLYYDGIRTDERLYLVSEVMVFDEYVEPDELVDSLEYNDVAASIDCVYLGDSIYGYLPGNVIMQIYDAFLKSYDLKSFTKPTDDGRRYVLYTDITNIDHKWDFMLTKFITLTPNEFNEIYPDSAKFKRDDDDFLVYDEQAKIIPLNSNPFREIPTRVQPEAHVTKPDGTLEKVLMTSDVIKMLSLFSFYVAGGERMLMCIQR